MDALSLSVLHLLSPLSGRLDWREVERETRSREQHKGWVDHQHFFFQIGEMVKMEGR